MQNGALHAKRQTCMQTGARACKTALVHAKRRTGMRACAFAACEKPTKPVQMQAREVCGVVPSSMENALRLEALSQAQPAVGGSAALTTLRVSEIHGHFAPLRQRLTDRSAAMKSKAAKRRLLARAGTGAHNVGNERRLRLHCAPVVLHRDLVKESLALLAPAAVLCEDATAKDCSSARETRRGCLTTIHSPPKAPLESSRSPSDDNHHHLKMETRRLRMR
eukprot:6179461-Pleurochrysis_carterae.AAC.2